MVWHGSHGFGILLSLFFLSFLLFSSYSSKWRGDDDDGKGELVLLPLLLFLYSTRMKVYRMDIEVMIGA